MRPKDLLDVQTIIETAQLDLELAKELARRFRIDKKLERILEDIIITNG